ncbi:MAG: SCP2 sterol-binding domain-containing protein [Lachnospiraceae bacterium]|nr:SCP2 sterol-binding domain-containing protein [Lachnospiraceae bacterium]
MTFQEFFLEIKKNLKSTDISDMTDHLAYQFNIEGEEAGTFYVEAKDGELYVEPYEYLDRDVIFTCTADTLRKIAMGDMNPIMAYTIHKLKIDGSIDKALKLKDIIDRIK